MVQKSNNPLKLKHVVKFERLIYDIMFSHLVESNLVSENQSGFNSCNSWINQLMKYILALNIIMEFGKSSCIDQAFLVRYNIKKSFINYDKIGSERACRTFY